MSKVDSMMWIEKFRSKTVKDVILPREYSKFFKNVLEKKEIPNLLLYSKTPGTGKTTVAKALVSELNVEYLFINASLDNKIDVLRTKITEFAQTVSLSSSIKVVILDESEKLTPSFQEALRGFTELYYQNCRFILTCNNEKKLTKALKDRLMAFDFDMKDHRKELVPKITKRINGIIKFEKLNCSPEIVNNLVEQKYPSVRSMIRTLEQYTLSKGSDIDESILKLSDSDSTISDMILSKKKFSDVMYYIENNGITPEDVFTGLYKNFVPRATQWTKAIEIIANYDYRCSFTHDSSLQIAAAIVELMRCV